MTQPDAAPPRDRRNPSLGDMVRSVVVLGVLAGLVVAFTAFLRDDPPKPASDVDYRQIATEASEGVDYPLLAPADVPDGWRANAARLDPGDPPSWHLGMVTADDDYVGLEQAEASVGSMVKKYARGARSDGTASLGGETWSVRVADDETTFVRRDSDVTVLVTGDAPRDEMEGYVESLEPA
ncbi:DUF4245 domain-containing protein [Solicola gregarius]|uniref:DUF4245 domain-containing protein n=1 Tax=Solicola gregarius TaxID=2908642 RepID=A0AA46TJX3_9ACTN|nr:DUF4245 domain-containing protein [Solicola gregarius]UYM06244.1 DUF4245 domain-containing protein [Solicola gregarius]